MILIWGTINNYEKAIDNYESIVKTNDCELEELSNTNNNLLEQNMILTRENESLKSLLDTMDQRKITLTNYYPNDKEGSGYQTGSGLSVTDFTIDAETGWYKFNGYVVIATATKECANSNYGACKNYKEVPSGYGIYEYGDIITFEFNHKFYKGIVLDSCGASYWERDYQTFDVFISNSSHAFGKGVATIYE